MRLPLITALMSVCFCVLAAAQERYVEVTAEGQAWVPADWAVLNTTLSVSGDTVTEVQNSYQQKKEKLDTALDSMELRPVTLKIYQASLKSGNGMTGGLGLVVPGAAAAAPVAATEFTNSSKVELRIKLADLAGDPLLETVNVLHQKLKEMEMGFAADSPTSQELLTLEFAEPVKANQQAIKNAFQHAKTKATVLAELAGGKLGPAISIEELPETSTTSQDAYTQIIQFSMGAMNLQPGTNVDDEGRIRASTTVRVRFAIQ